MRKIIIIIIVLVVLILGGWYLYSQQGTEQEVGNSGVPSGEETTPTDTSSNEDEKETKTNKENPYNKAEEVPAIPGQNEEIHKISERILTSVFDEIKLTDTDSTANPATPKFDYEADYNYIVSEVITMDQAKQIREEIIEEGGEINSTDVKPKSYRYRYNFEMDGKEYSANMGIFIGGEEELGDIGDRAQTIEIDIRLNS